ncbi:MAG: AI-2E family transporter [Acidobacteriota bacterium]|nr:AI-2E family transporter [Acidobacteriota bacterium]
MFGLDDKALRIAWTVFLFCLALAIVYAIRQTLLVFAGAIFFAYILSPVVSLIEEFIPKRRTIALAVVYVLFVGAIVGIGFALIPPIVSQASSLVSRLPDLLNGGQLARIPLPHWLDPVRAQIISAAHREASNLEASVMPILQRAGTQLLSGVGLILPIILTPILAFFFLKDGRAITRSLIGSMDEKQDRMVVRRILDDIHNVLKNYIRALVILALITFAVYSLFLKLVGVEYELLLAGLAGLLEFIPVIGPAVALVIILIVALVTGSGAFLWIIIFFGVYRVFQDYVVNPYLMRAGLELHPLLVLFGVLAGDQIGGVPGMFFSVPVIAMLKVTYLNLKNSYDSRQLSTVSEEVISSRGQ